MGGEWITANIYTTLTGLALRLLRCIKGHIGPGPLVLSLSKGARFEPVEGCSLWRALPTNGNPSPVGIIIPGNSLKSNQSFEVALQSAPPRRKAGFTIGTAHGFQKLCGTRTQLRAGPRQRQGQQQAMMAIQDILVSGSRFHESSIRHLVSQKYALMILHSAEIIIRS